MKKEFLVLVFLLVLISDITQADTDTVGTKVDTVLKNQEKIMEKQDRIYDEVKYIDPLVDKKFGIEFNPALFLIESLNKDDIVLRGGFSLFNIDRGAEVAFPIYYSKRKDSDDTTTTITTIDCHYRKFLGKHQNGFYVSAGTRYAYIEGIKDDYYDKNVITANKLGLTFGIGYRYFSNKRFYWGTSLSIGRYFNDADKNFSNAGIDGAKFILDMELLKIGIAF